MTRKRSACKWDPVVSRDAQYTHYVYPAAFLRLDYWAWWRERRLVLMAAYPFHLTWQEYVTRYLTLHMLGERLRGG